MERDDRFVWNEKTGRIEVGAAAEAAEAPAMSEEEAYQAYLSEGYPAYMDTGEVAAESLCADADFTDADFTDADFTDSDFPIPEDTEPDDAGYDAAAAVKKKRHRLPPAVSFVLLCFSLVLGAVMMVTGAITEARARGYTGTEELPAMTIPEGTRAGMTTVAGTVLEAVVEDGVGVGVADPAAIRGSMDTVVLIGTEAPVKTEEGEGIFVWAGAGVVLREDGYILTCAHVVNGGRTVRVWDEDGREYETAVVAVWEEQDLAILKSDAEDLHPATLAEAGELNEGDLIYVIGNPFGNFVVCVSQGIVSAVNKPVNIDTREVELVRFDAAVNPGNSGGGLFDSEGRLVGVVNARGVINGTEHVGFAIPIDKVYAFLESLNEAAGFEL